MFWNISKIILRTAASYTVLKYPQAVQKEIVEHYIEIRDQVATEDEEEDVAENASFDRATYNRKMNRP